MNDNSDETLVLPGGLNDGTLLRQFTRRAALKAGASTFAVGGLSALLAACGSSSGSASSKTSGTSGSSTPKDSLTVASALGATNFDPEATAGSLTQCPILYDALFDTSTPPLLADAQKLLADYNPEPALATAWVQSADKLTWTLTLNTKAKALWAILSPQLMSSGRSNGTWP